MQARAKESKLAPWMVVVRGKESLLSRSSQLAPTPSQDMVLPMNDARDRYQTGRHPQVLVVVVIRKTLKVVVS